MSFIPDPGVIAAFTLAAILLTLTPGPDMTLFLGKTVAQGRAAGFAAFLGASSGLVVHSTLAAVGLSALLAASETAFTLLKVVGALYLLWLAVNAVRHGAAFSLDGTEPRREPLARIYLTGVLINLLNPKIIVFFVTFLPQFVDVGDPDAGGKFFFLGMLFIVVATPFTAVMILSAERIAGLLKASPRALKAFDWVFAGVMGAFAVRLALTHTR